MASASRNQQQRRSASPLDVYDYDAGGSPTGMPTGGVGVLGMAGAGSALAEAREGALKKSLGESAQNARRFTPPMPSTSRATPSLSFRRPVTPSSVWRRRGRRVVGG